MCPFNIGERRAEGAPALLWRCSSVLVRVAARVLARVGLAQRNDPVGDHGQARLERASGQEGKLLEFALYRAAACCGRVAQCLKSIADTARLPLDSARCSGTFRPLARPRARASTMGWTGSLERWLQSDSPKMSVLWWLESGCIQQRELGYGDQPPTSVGCGNPGAAPARGCACAGTHRWTRPCCTPAPAATHPPHTHFSHRMRSIAMLCFFGAQGSAVGAAATRFWNWFSINQLHAQKGS